MASYDTPDIGDSVTFENAPGSVIEVQSVPSEQPLSKDGIIVFVDQYDEAKLCARDGDDWVIVMDSELTPEQSDAVFDILNPGASAAP